MIKALRRKSYITIIMEREKERRKIMTLREEEDEAFLRLIRYARRLRRTKGHELKAFNNLDHSSPIEPK